MDSLNLPLKNKVKKSKKQTFEDFFNKNKISLIFGFLGIFLLGVAVLSTIISSSKNKNNSIEILPVQNQPEQTKEIFVHLAGAVQKPGLYKLKPKARVNDVLIMAGGLSAKADRKWFETNINLAQPLTDGAKIYIPFKGEKQGNIAGAKTFSEKINLNTASLSQLQSLPKIGPAYAQKIIDNRPFAKIEDILKVPGIGNKTFNTIKDKITVF